MDLQRLGARDSPSSSSTRTWEETGDYGAVSLLDFYRAYRALVRAKVLGFQVSERPELVPATRALFHSPGASRSRVARLAC